MHTPYKAEQKRADKLSRDEAARELRNEQNSDGVCRQLKNTLDPKDKSRRSLGQRAGLGLHYINGASSSRCRLLPFQNLPL
jgi:hypothetical protein